jgi:hypothetical protein
VAAVDQEILVHLVAVAALGILIILMPQEAEGAVAADAEMVAVAAITPAVQDLGLLERFQMAEMRRVGFMTCLHMG